MEAFIYRIRRLFIVLIVSIRMTKQITILFGRMHNKTLQLAKYAKCLLMQNYTIHISTT